MNVLLCKSEHTLKYFICFIEGKLDEIKRRKPHQCVGFKILAVCVRGRLEAIRPLKHLHCCSQDNGETATDHMTSFSFRHPPTSIMKTLPLPVRVNGWNLLKNKILPRNGLNYENSES
jgi:hypothetical protein